MEGKSQNYTLQSRQGKVVKFEEEARDSFFINDNKKWDIYTGFESSRATWQIGHSDMSDHVLTCFHKKDIFDLMQKKFYGENYNIQKNSTSEKNKPVTKCEECCDKPSDINVSYKCVIEKGEGIRLDGPYTCTLSSCDKKYGTLCSNNHVKHEGLDSLGLICKKENDTNDKENNTNDTVNVESDKTLTEMEISEKGIKHECVSVPEKIPSKGGIDPDMEQRILSKLKRKLNSHNEIETEAYHRDKPPLYLISESQEELSKRCVCISNILRSFSFIPGK